MEDRIVMIKTKFLLHHPENPRKEIGDVTELANSVKAQGIMQNLTVIPGMPKERDYNPDVPVDAFYEHPNNGDMFYVLIGNRRLEAAKAAGLEEVPCRIVTKMPLREQVAIMMQENMQRSDLTIMEQADGFQMMLDLGESANSISEKTGFSKSTVYHRLNLAKLDRDVLKKKQDEYQLTLDDLYQLERIEDVDDRNKILKNITNGQQLKFRVDNYLDNKRIDEMEVRLIELLKKAGIDKAEEGTTQYTPGWEQAKYIDLSREKSVEYILNDLEEDKSQYGWYKTSWGRNYVILVKTEVDEEDDAEKAAEELAKQKEEERKEKANEVIKAMAARRRELIWKIVDGDIEIPSAKRKKHEKEWLIELIELMYKVDASADAHEGACFVLRNNSWWQMEEDEQKEGMDKFSKLGAIEKMIISLLTSLCNPINWRGELLEKTAGEILAVDEFLTKFGWIYEGEEEAILKGQCDWVPVKAN